MKFGTHIPNIKLQNGIKNQPVIMQGYICNICTETNRVQNTTTRLNRMKCDMHIHVAKLRK